MTRLEMIKELVEARRARARLVAEAELSEAYEVVAELDHPEVLDVQEASILMNEDVSRKLVDRD